MTVHKVRDLGSTPKPFLLGVLLRAQEDINNLQMRSAEDTKLGDRGSPLTEA